ncbi:ABC transporter permease, partial [Escherichia coli]|nr:ABC transporter permease [Escherichia coli]
MYRAALSALLSHWWRHKVQLASLLLGLALATALWSGVQAINAQARDSYDRAAQMLGQGRYARLVSPEGPMDQARFATLRRAGWPVSPLIEGRLRLSDGAVRLIGIEPLTAPQGVAPEGLEATASDFAD